MYPSLNPLSNVYVFLLESSRCGQGWTSDSFFCVGGSSGSRSQEWCDIRPPAIEDKGKKRSAVLGIFKAA
jgi:hypothetical protein